MTTILAACGGNNAPAESAPAASASPSDSAASPEASAASELSGKIKVLTHRTDFLNDGTLDKYAAAFKEKYPKAEIEFEGLTNYATDIQVRLTTGEAGDVLMLPAGLAVSEYPKYFEPLPDDFFTNTFSLTCRCSMANVMDCRLA